MTIEKLQDLNNTEQSYLGTRIGSELVTRKYGDVLREVFYGADAADTARYTAIWIVPRPSEIIEVNVSYTALSTSGTLQLERLESGVAPGSGDSILTSAMDLADTVNSPITVNQNGMTKSNLLLAGDRIGLVDGGDLTNLENLIVQIYYKPRARGDYT